MAMNIVKILFMIVYFVVCMAVIVLTFVQTKDSSGASGTIVGSSSNNFYEKNKGRTKEGKLKRTTITLGVVFAILTIALGIIYAV